LARSSHASIERLMTIARRLGQGDLSARVGLLAAEPELATLAATLDDMAGRLSASIAHERAVEAMRRDMCTAISHDLRTPLASIKAISEALGGARLEGADLVVEVVDSGQGMPEWQLPLVFEPFWRGDAARSSPGSGLGLTLAKRIVEHLGGEIGVTSRLGEGSRFTVRVPANRGS